VGKLNPSFAEDASLFLELLDTLLDKALDLGAHLAARRAAGRLEAVCIDAGRSRLSRFIGSVGRATASPSTG